MNIYQRRPQEKADEVDAPLSSSHMERPTTFSRKKIS